MTQTKHFCDAPGCKAEIPASRTVVTVASGNARKGDSLVYDFCDVHAAALRAHLDPPEAPKARARRPTGPRPQPSA